MKYLKNLNPNEESKFYITGLMFSVVALFVVTGVVFLMLIANKLNVVMSQSAGDTYTYFIVIMDRISVILSVFVILPLTVYQLVSKNKSKFDKTVSLSAILVLLGFMGVIFSGEYFFYKKYSEGKLNNSKMFCGEMIEKELFNKIIDYQGQKIPEMCVVTESDFE